MLAIKQELPKPSRRGFLIGAAATGVIGMTRGFGGTALPERTDSSLRVLTWNTAGEAVSAEQIARGKAQLLLHPPHAGTHEAENDLRSARGRCRSAVGARARVARFEPYLLCRYAEDARQSRKGPCPNALPHVG